MREKEEMGEEGSLVRNMVGEKLSIDKGG